MGIQDRDYTRGDRRSGGGWSGISGITPAVKYLLIANVVVFLGQIFIVRHPDPAAIRAEEERINQRFVERFRDRLPADPEAPLPDDLRRDLEREMAPLWQLKRSSSVVTNWLELDFGSLFRGQIWRLVTYAFCHDTDSPWHIVFNMLGLWWFGPATEQMRGTREFLVFYLGAVLAGALAFIGLDLVTGARGPMIGASAAIMGTLTLYAYYYPSTVIYLFWVLPLEMRYAVIVWAIIDLHPVLRELTGSGFSDGIAHSAHLGGMAFGFLYARGGWHLSTIGEPLGELVSSWSTKRRRRPSNRNLRVFDPEAEPTGPRLMQSDDDRLQEELDEVLRKMHEVGRAGLTPAELAVLEEASARFARKRRPE